MTNKIIMANAWAIAKNGATKFGGKAVDYIAEAMKLAWKWYKEMRAKKGGKIVGICEWFLEKTLGNPSAVAQVEQSTYKVTKETKKAYYIKAIAYEDGMEIVNEFWAPKSVCA